MEQKNYLKAKKAEKEAERQPSKQHTLPIVIFSSEDGRVINREEQ